MNEVKKKDPVLGAILFALVVGVLVYFFIQREKNKPKTQEDVIHFKATWKGTIYPVN